MKVLAVVPCATVVLACTSITVRPIEAAAQLEHVCIQGNPKVLVADFVPVLRDGLSRHGISSETFTGSAPEDCAFIPTYTAFRSWDFAPYLSHAEPSTRPAPSRGDDVGDAPSFIGEAIRSRLWAFASICTDGSCSRIGVDITSGSAGIPTAR